METTESKRFDVGDVVRCVRGTLSGTFRLLEDREYVVSVVHTHGDVSLEGETDQQSGWFASRFELVRRAPASPAQEAPAQPTLPRPGQTWRVKNPESDDFGKTVTINLVSETHVHYDWLPPERLHNCTRRLDHFNECFEPAPSAPSESAAKQDSKPVSSVAKPDPYAQHREKLQAQFHGDVEAALTKHMHFRDDCARRIAVARAELDQPSAERRARLHPHEGRSDRVYGGRRWE